MRDSVVAKKESIYEQAAKSILGRQSKDFNVWKLDILSKRKMDILSGKDRAWEKGVIEEECIKLMAKHTK